MGCLRVVLKQALPRRLRLEIWKSHLQKRSGIQYRTSKESRTSPNTSPNSVFRLRKTKVQEELAKKPRLQTLEHLLSFRNDEILKH